MALWTTGRTYSKASKPMIGSHAPRPLLLHKPRRRIAALSVFSEIGRSGLRAPGKTRRRWPVTLCNSRRIATACSASGTSKPRRILSFVQEFSTPRCRDRTQPTRARKLARSGENQRQKFQRSFGFGLADEAIDGPEEPAKRDRVEDGRSVFDLRGEQGATSAMVGSFAARAVAMANRKTWPMVARIYAPNFEFPSPFDGGEAPITSAALTSAMGRFPDRPTQFQTTMLSFLGSCRPFPSPSFRASSSSATALNVLAAATRLVIRSRRRSIEGSLPLPTSSLATSRFLRASARLTSGYEPSARAFCLP